MRGKIIFPNRKKPIEREVHHDAGGYYIVSSNSNVPVMKNPDGTWGIDPAYLYRYEEGR